MSAVVHRYRVVFEKEKDGQYSVHCPSLKGVHSQGPTYEEARSNIREAIEGWIQVAQEYCDPIRASAVVDVTLKGRMRT